jgi:cytoskeletal protein RodZ
VSIGDALAAARRQAGLTITQVSQRTCIRETIIRGIERGDYSACGGDFYARGHIRNIARAVGLDPEPLIREYDETLGTPRPITAADAFEPARPIKLRERRGHNWSAALAAVLLVLIGYGVYHFATRSQHAKPAADIGRSHHPAATTSATPVVRQRKHAHRVIIHLTAVGDCWVQLTTPSGRTIFTGLLYPGMVKRWTEHRAVQLELGNPAGVKLTVNGKNAVPASAASQPITLTLGPHRKNLS